MHKFFYICIETNLNRLIPFINMQINKRIERKFTAKDYALYFLTVIILLIVYLALGNYGEIFGPLSNATEQIAFIYRVTFYAAGVIFALFVGALIYFTIRFWDRGERDGSD